MSIPCNEPVSDFELLGRSLTETPSINKSGEIKKTALYPRWKADKEPERTHLFTNKISVVRVCRGQNGAFEWKEHVECFKSSLSKNMTFRGFMLIKAKEVRKKKLHVEADGSCKNPYHAHIILVDYNVEYRERKLDPETNQDELISVIIPGKIRRKLDRLHRDAKSVILDFTPKIVETNKNEKNVICDSTYIPCTNC